MDRSRQPENKGIHGLTPFFFGEKDKEELRLEIEVAPGWAPGRSMKPGRVAVKMAVLPKGVGEGGDTA
jgi:hypothetical protein